MELSKYSQSLSEEASYTRSPRCTINEGLLSNDAILLNNSNCTESFDSRKSKVLSNHPVLCVSPIRINEFGRSEFSSELFKLK